MTGWALFEEWERQRLLEEYGSVDVLVGTVTLCVCMRACVRVCVRGLVCSPSHSMAACSLVPRAALAKINGEKVTLLFPVYFRECGEGLGMRLGCMIEAGIHVGKDWQ